MTLISKSQYQDALILHFMYSLSLDPYHIFGLCYEDVLSNTKIQWWDYKTSSMKSGFLYYELWSDIMTIKKYTEWKIGESRVKVRNMLDQKRIKGHFIIDASPTNIYNKFKRHFSNSVPNFIYTPKEIIDLSLLNSKTKSWYHYKRSLFNCSRVAHVNKILSSQSNS